MNSKSLIKATFEAIDESMSFDKVMRLTNETFLAGTTDADSQPVLQLHPLGFLALAWPIDDFRVLRLHYWSRIFDWAQSDDLQIHDHTFEFKSAVLLGRIRNEVYSIQRDVNGEIVYLTSYDGQKSLLHPQQERVAVLLESRELCDEGSIYSMPAGLLHRTELDSEEGLTVLATKYASATRNGARVIGGSRDGGHVFKRSAVDEIRSNLLLKSVENALAAAVERNGNS